MDETIKNIFEMISQMVYNMSKLERQLKKNSEKLDLFLKQPYTAKTEDDGDCYFPDFDRNFDCCTSEDCGDCYRKYPFSEDPCILPIMLRKLYAYEHGEGFVADDAPFVESL